jgi:hypothetical protein
MFLDLIALILKQIDIDPKRPRFWTLATLATIIVAFTLMNHWWATIATLLVAAIIWSQSSKLRRDNYEQAINETMSHIGRLTVKLLDERPNGIAKNELLKAAIVAMETNHWTAGQPWGVILLAQERILSPMLKSGQIQKVERSVVFPKTQRIEKVTMYVKTALF